MEQRYDRDQQHGAGLQILLGVSIERSEERYRDLGFAIVSLPSLVGCLSLHAYTVDSSAVDNARKTVERLLTFSTVALSLDPVRE
jgi:hypothetical protein